MVMENENDCEPLENYYKAPSAQPNPVPSKVTCRLFKPDECLPFP